MLHSENPLSALWRSAVAEAVSRQLGGGGKGAATDTAHPVLAATEAYLDAFEDGTELTAPLAGLRDDDPAVAAYLSQLNHRAAHAGAVGDSALQAQLVTQRDAYTMGNPLWEQMAEQYIRYYGQYLGHDSGQPAYRDWGHDLDFGVVEWRLPAKAKIAVIGDIGTGTDVAAAVLLAALAQQPDAILHLGDVYYSGTEFEFAHRYTGLFETVFEQTGRRVPVFGVPGNHEYFTGAHAYLACLDSGTLTVEPSQRQAASYFCLRSADDGWQFLGMDTAYHGHALSMPPNMLADALQRLHRSDPDVPDTVAPMSLLPADDPGLVRLREDELTWHAHKLASFGGRSVLLSHHQLYSAAQKVGTAQRLGADGKPDPTDTAREWVDTALWTQLGSYFGDPVAAWLWGHEHNLNIFADGYRPAGWPSGDTPPLRTLPKGRCLGHAAIPVAEHENPYAHTYPVPLVSDDATLALTDGWYDRGFALLELAGAGAPLTARYYQVTGVDPHATLIHTESID